LTRDQQQVVALHFMEGHSTAEVATLMHKNPEVIRSLKHRALPSLQTCLTDDAIGKPAYKVRAAG
jgi:DNA-directed RNA polymerase specialized sigma24 family protein